jgi:hypothetical protein
MNKTNMNDANLNKQINITLKDGQEVKCECGNPNWLPVVRFFKFSRILTGQNKDAITPVEVFLCSVCGKACQDMLPSELKESKPKIDLSNIKIENQ